MKKQLHIVRNLALAAIAVTGLLDWQVQAADDHKVIEEVMKTYHKAPKGIDPTCKKAADGKASAEELKNLVAAYQKLAATKPPKGDAASWKEKTSKLLTASQSLQKGEEGAIAKYKEAVNCKACHSAHKPD